MNIKFSVKASQKSGYYDSRGGKKSGMGCLKKTCIWDGQLSTNIWLYSVDLNIPQWQRILNVFSQEHSFMTMRRSTKKKKIQSFDFSPTKIATRLRYSWNCARTGMKTEPKLFWTAAEMNFKFPEFRMHHMVKHKQSKTASPSKPQSQLNNPVFQISHDWSSDIQIVTRKGCIMHQPLLPFVPFLSWKSLFFPFSSGDWKVTEGEYSIFTSSVCNYWLFQQ